MLLQYCFGLTSKVFIYGLALITRYLKNRVLMQNSILHQLFTREVFSQEELDQIIPCFKKVAFAKGDYLLRDGQIANDYWFVESGFIRAFVIDTSGNEVSINFYAAGDIVIDWPSFFLRTPTREYFQALTDCICWQLDFASFQTLFHGIEAFREAGRARLVSNYFALKRHSISLITDQATDRYLTLLAEKPDLIQNVSLKQIASYLGITDTSLSRIRKEIAGRS
jgi:CRP-like cAMP-binding protein